MTEYAETGAAATLAYQLGRIANWPAEDTTTDLRTVARQALEDYRAALIAHYDRILGPVAA